MQSTYSFENNPKKKSTLYAERDEAKRTRFIKRISKINRNKLIYIDESGIEKFLTREHGWSPRGQVISSDISGKRYARENFIAGYSGSNVIAPLCYPGTCDSTLVNYWLEEFLLPELGSGYTLILDNAKFHKSARTRIIVRKAKCKIIFLPPYSPDLIPIEKFWANLKKKIKGLISKCITLADAVDEAFKAIK